MIMFLFPSASSARCAETVCAVGAFYIFAGEGVEIWGQDIIMVVSFPHLSIDRKHCPKCDSCFGQLNSRAWATAEYIASNRKDHVYSFCMRWILGCLL